MEHCHTHCVCCAFNKSKGTRCTFTAQKGHEFCGVHLKSKNVVRYDEINVSSIENSHKSSKSSKSSISSNLKNNGKQTPAVLIPIYDRARLRYNTVKVRDLHKTLEHYGQSTDGNKKVLFDKLLTYFDSLLPYVKYTSEILSIQTWFRTLVSRTIVQLKRDFNYSIADCVNDSDVLTLEPLSSLNQKYLFTYKDNDGFIYGFDLRSFNKLIDQDSNNPYTSKPIDQVTLNKSKRLIQLQVLMGLSLEQNDEEIDANDSKYNIKRRVVKVFQEMDNLDQYTNPAWFLDLSTSSLIKFYKEAEDIWNYRLNLTKETQTRIYPPDGKVFKVEPKNILKNYDTKDSLRSLCLDVIERLIYSAEDRSDRVNGCIYVLLALVIVNTEAALAMPSYYTMVTGDIGNANYLDIPI